jgi:hypothetical protein
VPQALGCRLAATRGLPASFETHPKRQPVRPTPTEGGRCFSELPGQSVWQVLARLLPAAVTGAVASGLSRCSARACLAAASMTLRGAVALTDRKVALRVAR